MAHHESSSYLPELHCILCGITFSIGRIRTAGESQHAAWGPTVQNYVTGVGNCTSSKCRLAARVYVKDGENDPNPINVPRVREVLIPLPTVRGEPATKRQKIFHGVDYSKFEHIAGPDCGHQGGYNGSRIKPVEMAGCRTLQFLADKDDEDEWEPDDEALPFESYSRCFLTGLSDCARLHRTEVVPPRNDLDSPLLNDYIQEDREISQWSLPFHPWCFDIFMRISRERFGYIPANALIFWYSEGSCSYLPYHTFALVTRAFQAKPWSHETGQEYLAANPIFIPKLPSLLHAAVQKSPSFSPQDGAFDIPEPGDYSTASASCDPFLGLPMELRIAIVDYLNSKEIANLRLSSRAFRQLPIFLWYRLLREEMPWLWEVYSNDMPFPWATVTATAIKRFKHVYPQIQLYCAAIRGEMRSVLAARRTALTTFCHLPGTVSAVSVKLPRHKTNWYRLYSDIKRHWDELKGLQNRRRIWGNIESIISELEAHLPTVHAEVNKMMEVGRCDVCNDCLRVDARLKKIDNDLINRHYLGVLQEIGSTSSR